MGNGFGDGCLTFIHNNNKYLKRFKKVKKKTGSESILDKWLLNFGDTIIKKISAATGHCSTNNEL